MEPISLPEIQRLDEVVAASRTARAARACVMTTRDRDHAFYVVRAVAMSHTVELHHFWSGGARSLDSSQVRWTESSQRPSSPEDMLRFAAALDGSAIAVLEDFTMAIRDDGGDAALRAQIAQLLSHENRRNGLVLVFLEGTQALRFVPSILSEQIVRIDLAYPRRTELATVVKDELAALAHHNQWGLRVDEISSHSERLAPDLAGLTRSAARDLTRDVFTIKPLDFDAVHVRLQNAKAEKLRSELGMNVLSTEDAEEPVGLDYLVEYVDINRARMAVYGPRRAKGILLVGPPGSGKTMLARCIGQMVNLPVVEFRLSALMNSLLGETEQRFARAFAALEAMAPNVVFIDEIEKAFGDSSERDGGTMMRCTGALLSWLSDNPHPNFIVATSNSLARMGEIGLTMTRSERFDTAFFVDVPSLESRRKMLARWLEDGVADAPSIAQELARMTERFSGADLRSVVKQAHAAAEHERTQLSHEHLQRQVQRKRSRVEALYQQFQQLREWGRVFCDPAGPQ